MKLSGSFSKRLSFLLIIFVFIIPLIITLTSILTGTIPFWYDNARDMLLAWDNLQKPTLIGPTSGIPGIFYGPYWIWLLSIGLFFSKDPRVAALVVGIIPYFIFFPLILARFTGIFSQKTLVLIWLSFILSTGFNYATYMWNPHLAPLLLLLLISLLYTSNDKKGLHSLGTTICAGVTMGLLINFHISLGLGVFLGVMLFFIVYIMIKLIYKKPMLQSVLEYLTTIFLFLLGVAITFTPFLLFELRHGFNQVQTIIKAFSTLGGVITVTGLSKEQIIELFFARIGVLLHTNLIITVVICILSGAYLLYMIQYQKYKFSEREKKLGILLGALCIGILFTYLTAKNPVWEYHFIGTEIIFMLVLALIINKLSILRTLLTVWITFLFVSYVTSYMINLSTPLYTASTLATKEYIVDIIANDSDTREYTVFNYSPSIYQYEYTYLFKWRYGKDVPYDPGAIALGSPITYLVIPDISDAEKESYINDRTPDIEYQTSRVWKIPDGTSIIKRVSTLKKNISLRYD